ncbi:hypothetical protein [Flavobacterium sp.]|uniref:hypothetical protein n=1 Tax=Flavobacterium sp. TaxID=239 RepID=UPI002FDEEE92
MRNLILLFITTFFLSCCNDDDKPVAEIDKLPQATQTGANTVGCLLNGKAFLPGNQPNSTNCFYQLVDGEYYFVMAFDNRDANNNLIGLGIGTQKLQIQQGSIYNLFELSDNNAYGGFVFGTLNSYTTQTYTGEFTITKLDEVNHIVSGTFWFDVLDTFGVVHQIREGRFDMQYTN